MDRIRELLIENMKTARSRLGLSQAGLAERCGLTASYVAQIETGRKFPSSTTLLLISDALHLEPHQLIMPTEHDPDFERHRVVAQIADELKSDLVSVVDRVTMRHIRGSRDTGDS